LRTFLSSCRNKKLNDIFLELRKLLQVQSDSGILIDLILGC
jgi:hypothetical protein